MRSISSVLAQGVGAAGLDLHPVAQDRHPVGERPHLLEPVGHEDHAGPLGGDRAHRREQPLDAVARQVGRRLVEHQHAAVDALQPVEGPHDGEERPLDLAQRPHLGVRPDVAEAKWPQRLPHQPPLVPPRDPPQRAGLVVADAQVLEHAHLGHQPEVLVHERDAEQVRRAGVERQRHRLAGHLQGRAVVGRVVAGQDLDEGRLARAVLAEQAVHLPGQDVEVDVRQDGPAREGLREAPRRQGRCLLPLGLAHLT